MHQVHFNNLGSTNVYISPYMKQKLFILQHRVRYQLVVNKAEVLASLKRNWAEWGLQGPYIYL
jgi:hypothetical protein